MGWKEAPERVCIFWKKNWIRNMYCGGRRLQRGFASSLNKNRIRNMYWGGRKLQRWFASTFNNDWMRNMYWGGRNLQRGFTLVLNQELNKEYILGEEVSSRQDPYWNMMRYPFLANWIQSEISKNFKTKCVSSCLILKLESQFKVSAFRF